MHFFITGAAGFIGSNLSLALLQLGHQVTGIDNLNDFYDVNLKKKNLADLQKKFIDFYKVDLCEKSELEQLPVHNIDFVVHLAAQPGLDPHTSFNSYLQNNTIATYNLLEYFKNFHAKHLKLFINISTSSVYGLTAKGDEQQVPQPVSYYGVTKLAAEQLALSYFRNGMLPVCSLRLFSVYGPRERNDKMFPKLIAAALLQTSFHLYSGSLEHIRSFTYVEDIVEGIKKLIENYENCYGEIINLGSNETYTVKECIRLVENLTHSSIHLKQLPARNGDQKSTKAQIEKAGRLIGFKPTTTLQSGVKQQIQFFKETLICE